MAAPLPKILQEVADAAGLEAALQLARARGGRSLYVPSRPTRGFVEAVGEAAANALSDLYGDEKIIVPLGPAGSMNDARRTADLALAQGMSASEAARLSGMTERGVRKRKRRARLEPDARQGRLFD